MDKNNLISIMAGQRMVEGIVCNIAHVSFLTADLCDLCQEVYLALMECDGNMLADLWRNDAMRYFIARIVLNQYKSVTSPFYAKIRRFRRRTEDVEGKDFCCNE